MTFPNASDVTISNNRLLSTLLKACLKESTFEAIIDTTPIKEATTRGSISKAPNMITPKKIKIEILAMFLF